MSVIVQRHGDIGMSHDVLQVFGVHPSVGEAGMVSMGMVDGLVVELKGFWIIGILRVLYELVKNMILNGAMEKRLAGKKVG